MTALLASLLLQAAEPLGTWEGTLEAGPQKIRLVLKVRKEADGALKGAVDVPGQGALGLALDPFSWKGGELRFEFKPAGFRFEGKLAEGGKRLEGRFRQAGLEFPLALEKTSDLALEAKRPQMPRPPFPYAVRDASFESVPGVRLSGTLTVPEGKGPHPAVVLVSGSGPQDRDESLMGHKPFLVLADHLTRKGIAVLRTDDRGFGKSTGDFASATTEDFARDTAAAVAWLRGQEGVDPARVGIAGHSEGGLVGPLVAAVDPKLAFLVLLAGPGVPGEAILLRQAELINRAAGQGDEAVRANRRTQERIFKAIRGAADPDAARREVAGILRESLPPGSEAQADRQAAATTTPWFRFFLAHDPRPVLSKVACPVLALCGEKDLQVDPKQNLPEIEKALRAGGNARVEVRELPGLNHLFQTARTGSPSEYGEIEETFAPAALEAVSEWILRQGGR